MMRARLTIGCFVVLVPALSAAADDKARTFDLGGPRQVKAEITAEEEDYVIKVRMRAVRVFDATTNAELNQEKARQYALQALARHLSDKKTVHFTVSGAVVDAARLEKSTYLLTLRVPRRGVTLLSEDVKPVDAPRTERVTFSSALFRARRDHEDTINRLAAVLAANLRNAEKKADPDDKRAFTESVRGIEKRGVENFDALADAVKADLLLSTVEMFGKPSERDELLAAVEQQKQRLRDLVKKMLQKHVKDKKE